MRRVAGEEDTALPEAVRERRARAGIRRPSAPPVRPPAESVLRSSTRARTYSGETLRLCGLVGELGRQLESPVPCQRAQRQGTAPGLRPHVPVVAVESCEPHIGDERGPGSTLSPVMPMPSALRTVLRPPSAATRNAAEPCWCRRPVVSSRRTPSPSCSRPVSRGAELHLAAQLAQPLVQHLLGAPLGEHPRISPYGSPPGRRRRSNMSNARPRAAALPEHADRGRAAARHGPRRRRPRSSRTSRRARLEALAPRAREERVALLHDAGPHAAAGQVAGEGEAGGPGADDQHVGGRRPFP